MNHWFEYVKSCYDLVTESENITKITLKVEVETYVVHLMARNFERIDIGKEAIAIQLLEAINTGRTDRLLTVADECLLIHSYPLRRSKWPSSTYYQDMGITAYGLANHIMEYNFDTSSKVLSTIFKRSTQHHLI